MSEPSTAETVLREFNSFLQEMLTEKRHPYEQLYRETKEELDKVKEKMEQLISYVSKLKAGFAEATVHANKDEDLDNDVYKNWWGLINESDK